jgi:hypothetical protein
MDYSAIEYICQRRAMKSRVQQTIAKEMTGHQSAKIPFETGGRA